MPAMTSDDLGNFANSQFDIHRPMHSLYQEIADNFYPERGDFTFSRSPGTEFASHLTDSMPIILRRDLGDAISAMLRDGDWFDIDVEGGADQMGKMWLQWATRRFRKLMYDTRSGFVRAGKDADHDFVTFGPTVMSCEPNRYRDGLLFRTWHLRDCAWWDDEAGQVEGMVRGWQPTRLDLVRLFGDKAHAEHTSKSTGKDGMKKCDILHLCLPSDLYGKDEFEQYPYVSVFYDRKHNHVMEEVGKNYHQYVVPRFKTMPGTPLAYSPATMVGLPGARTVQEMEATLMDAAERYANPPIIATEEAVRSDVNLFANGITWVDKSYDEKMGAALRTLQQDRGGYPIGMDAKERQIESLRQAFYTDTLAILQDDKERTAFEVSEMRKQFRRQNLPLFEPIEHEYSGQICELGFKVAMEMGLMGSAYDIPDSLAEADTEFKFKTPLTETDEEKVVQNFDIAMSMTERAAQLDPAAATNFNTDAALRDAISGGGAPEHWKRPVEQVAEIRKASAMAAAAQAAEQAPV